MSFVRTGSMTIVAVALFISALAPASAFAGDPAIRLRKSAPNVVIVITDDQGYGDLSCHGNPVLKTPSLDAMYAESVRLTDYHCLLYTSPSPRD